MDFGNEVMKNIKIFASVIVLFSVAVACKKNTIISHEQRMLFQLDYVNYAWGYQHNGLIIDVEGNVLTYNNPEKWNFPENDFILSAEHVAENLDKCRKTGIVIPKDELQRFAGYINNIALSKVTAPKNTGADQGSLEFVCYRFMENDLKYKGYLIKMEGDYTCENLNFYSKKVSSWIRDINERLPLK